MNPAHRAWAYIRRKRVRSLILLLIMTLLLTSMATCLSLLGYSQQLEDSLYRSLNTSFAIKRLEDGQPFELAQVKGLDQIKELGRAAPELEMNARLLTHQVVQAQQTIQRDDLAPQELNLVSLKGLTDSSRDASFRSAGFQLVVGRHLTDKDRQKVLIHEELAKKNGLSLHDSIQLAGVTESTTSTVRFEIIGIFKGKKEEQFTGLSSDFSENAIYSDYETSKQLLARGKDLVSTARFYLKEPQEMARSLKELEKLNLAAQGFQVQREDKAFQQIKEAVSSSRAFLQLFLWGILLAGATSLVLVLSLWMRERLYEVGILLALGKSKVSILSQFFLEILLISLFTLPLAFLGHILASGFLLDALFSSSQLLDSSRSLMANGLAFALAYAGLLVLAACSLSLSFALLFWKSPKAILSSIR